jgi:hypothetical protein
MSDDDDEVGDGSLAFDGDDATITVESSSSVMRSDDDDSATAGVALASSTLRFADLGGALGGLGVDAPRSSIASLLVGGDRSSRDAAPDRGSDRRAADRVVSSGCVPLRESRSARCLGASASLAGTGTCCTQSICAQALSIRAGVAYDARRVSIATMSSRAI